MDTQALQPQSQPNQSKLGRPVIEPSFLSDTNWLGINGAIFKKLTPFQRRFLTAFPTHLTITGTARSLNINEQSHHTWCRRSPSYRKCFDSVKEFVVLAMEEEAVIRATKGYTDDVFYKGEVVGTRRIVSDQLLMFLLRAARPDVYREKSQVELTGDAIQTEKSEFRDLDTDTLIQVKQLIAAARVKQKTVETR